MMLTTAILTVLSRIRVGPVIVHVVDINTAP